MVVNKEQDEIVYESLEKSIFNIEELEQLKQMIKKVSKGQIEPIEVKRHILNYRAELLERIFHTFQYYNKSTSSVSDNNDKDHLNAELEEKTQLLAEKDELFETLGTKIAALCTKLRTFLDQ